MLFNSYIFIFFFLPLCILGYFILNRFHNKKIGLSFLFIMSLWFYGYFNPYYLSIIVSSIVINYLFYRAFGKLHSFKKPLFIIALLVNTGILFYFKYFDFFIENLNSLFGADFALKNILLPLGISFFTFQQLSFIIDAYRGEITGYNFIEYALFVAFFPQLIAGPIVTHDEMIPQFRDDSKKRFDWDNFSKGLYLFALGLSKKVLIADFFSKTTDWGFTNIPALDSGNAILVMLAYTLQIYFDFSGYCDMAIALGKMLNLDIALNFNSPYKALTITGFWDRWHMTLTRFFTKYIYIPLGGNRKGVFRTYLNILIVFFISGVWHGANWTFIVWGVAHGIFSVITRAFHGFFSKIPAVLNRFITFTFVSLAWVMFRADSLTDAFRFIGRIFSFDFGHINNNIITCFNLDTFSIIVSKLTPFQITHAMCGTFVVLIMLAFVLITMHLKNAYERMLCMKTNLKTSVITIVLLVYCIVSLSGISTFLYFNF